MNCYNCKYYDTDYEFDGEDEYLDSDEECPYFKKCRQRKYVEKDTECDKCEFLEQRKDEGYVIDCTIYDGTREHYIRGLGSNCRSSKYAKRI